MKTFWIVSIAGSIQFQHAAAQPKQDKPDLICSDDFETDLSNWVVEQGEGGTAEIVNGQFNHPFSSLSRGWRTSGASGT